MIMRNARLEDYDLFNQMYTRFSITDEKNSRLGNKLPFEKYSNLIELQSIHFAVIDKKVMGFAVIYPYEDGECKIEILCMTEKNKGYGTQFYKIIEKEVKEANMKFIKIYVFDEDAERFWYRMGFESVRGTEEFRKIL